MRSSLSACLRVGKSNSIRELASVLAFQLASPHLLFSGWSVATSLAKLFSPGERYLCNLSPLQLKLVSEYVGRNAGRTHLLAGKNVRYSSDTPTTGGR